MSTVCKSTVHHYLKKWWNQILKQRSVSYLYHRLASGIWQCLFNIKEHTVALKLTLVQPQVSLSACQQITENTQFSFSLDKTVEKHQLIFPPRRFSCLCLPIRLHVWFHHPKHSCHTIINKTSSSLPYRQRWKASSLLPSLLLMAINLISPQHPSRWG